MAARAPDTLAVAFPSYRPCALTGMLELSLAQTAWSSILRPLRVGRILELMFDRISGQAVTPERIRHLTSSSREWLLQRAALQLWPDNGWFETNCSSCGKKFDLPIALSSTPRKPASDAFPVIEVETSLGKRRFEAPNGAHEEQIAVATAQDNPVRRLLGLCGLEKTAFADARQFTNDDLTTIESAFEVACPDIADELHTQCPACSVNINIRIDPLQFAFPRSRTLMHEIHLIASNYHWSEADILNMPSSRRSSYVELIRSSQDWGRSR